MRIRIEIDTDNAAFSDVDTGDVSASSLASELCYVLRRVVRERIASDCTHGEYLDGKLLDSNGNTCGKFEVLP